MRKAGVGLDAVLLGGQPSAVQALTALTAAGEGQLLQAGDIIRVKNRPKSLQAVQSNLSENNRQIPDFLTLVEGPIPEGVVARLPESFDVSIPVQPQLIIELCSK